MTTEQHLQQLIGTMAFQMASAAAQIDALTAELAELKAKPNVDPKPNPPSD